MMDKVVRETSSQDVTGGTQARAPVVLIVDDEEAMRDSCAQVLMREGFKVLMAESAEVALGAIAQRTRVPDIFLVDLKMPGMSGMEFMAKARQLDAQMVAIVITGYATLSSAIDAMKAGAYDFLPKPFKAEELRIVAARALEKRRLALAAGAAEREKSRMRDQFVAMVSHQLKSPLASLKQCLDVAVTSAPLPEPCRDLVDRARRRTTQMLHLVDDWITLAKMEAHMVAANAPAVDVKAVVEAAVETARDNLPSRNVRIDFQAEGSLLQLPGDKDALKELFVNLVDNALRYTPDGGSVKVRVVQEPTGAAVTVADNGPGIPPAELDLVFEPFYRGANVDKTEGTGLGLSIVRRIAHAHGGNVSVESALGKGTAFRVHLPFRGASDASEVRRE